MAYRLGIDIGGTFTDFALVNSTGFDEDAGTFAIHKQLTTPDDPSRAVLEGTTNLLARQGLDLSAVVEIVHGRNFKRDDLEHELDLDSGGHAALRGETFPADAHLERKQRQAVVDLAAKRDHLAVRLIAEEVVPFRDHEGVGGAGFPDGGAGGDEGADFGVVSVGEEVGDDLGAAGVAAAGAFLEEVEGAADGGDAARGIVNVDGIP